MQSPQGLPVAAAACFGYGGYQGLASLGLVKPFSWPRDAEALLKDQMVADEAADWERRRLMVERAKLMASLYPARVTKEANAYFAKGPRGIVLAMGESVSVLEEHVGDHKTYHMVRSSSGDVGLFPHAYLETEGATKVE